MRGWCRGMPNMQALRLVSDRMTPPPDRMERSIGRLWALDPYRSEFMLALASLWAAYALLTPPSNFETFRPGFSFAAQVATEHQWAVFALVAGCAKLGGLAATWCRRCQNAALMLRLIGLAMSGVFWVLLGLSACFGNPDTLFGFPVVLFGATAWWLLVRFPTIPME
jgi:hypothetical protein